MMHELPPQLQGTAEQQLHSLRDYLVRLAGSLDQVGSSAAAASTAAGRAQTEAVREVKSTAAGLKALIVKTADEIAAYTDSRVETLASLYVAKSDYGTYYNQIETQVEQTARDTVETYRYAEAIRALDSLITDLNGQSRRGVIEDPETH